jgi:hypothetical protein
MKLGMFILPHSFIGNVPKNYLLVTTVSPDGPSTLWLFAEVAAFQWPLKKAHSLNSHRGGLGIISL